MFRNRLSLFILKNAFESSETIRKIILYIYNTFPFQHKELLDWIYLNSSLQNYFSFRLNNAILTSNNQLAELIISRTMFSVETHHVVSYDGFSLVLHRITKNVPTNSSIQSAVLLVHGVLQDCEVFLCDGRESLTDLLIQSGYEVWLLSNRGCKYTQSSSNTENNSKQYTDSRSFSDDMYATDVRSAVSFIHNGMNSILSQSKLYCIGFSTGCSFVHNAITCNDVSDNYAAQLTRSQLDGVVYLSPILHLLPSSTKNSLKGSDTTCVINYPTPLSAIISSPQSLFNVMNISQYDKKRTQSTTDTAAAIDTSLVGSSLTQWRDILSAKTYAHFMSIVALYVFNWKFHNIELSRRRALFQHLFSPTLIQHVVFTIEMLRREGDSVTQQRQENARQSKPLYSFPLWRFNYSIFCWLLNVYCKISRGVIKVVSSSVGNMFGRYSSSSSVSNNNITADINIDNDGTQSSGECSPSSVIRRSSTATNNDNGSIESDRGVKLTIVAGTHDSLIDLFYLRDMVNIASSNSNSDNTVNRLGNQTVSTYNTITLHEMSQYEHMDVLWANYARRKVFRNIILPALNEQ